MKNIMSYLLVVFSFVNFNYALAVDQANKPDTTRGVRSKPAASSRSETKPLTVQKAGSCNDPSLPFKLSDMKYVGADLQPLVSPKCTVIRFGEKGTVVSDGIATIACQNLKLSTNSLNPGNPQYIGFVSGHGTRTDNALGYYFCVDFDKKVMCENRAADPIFLGKMKIEFQPDLKAKNKHNNNGDCKCKPANGDEAFSCPAEPSLVVGKCPNNSNSSWNETYAECRCNFDPERKFVAGGAACPNEPAPVVTRTVDDNDFRNCFSQVKASSDLCSAQGQAAIDKCSKEAPEVNKNIAEAQRVMSIATQALVAKNAGTGALEGCAAMSAGGTAAMGALGLLSKSCKNEINNCKQGCEDVKAYSQRKMDDLAKECKESFGEKPWTPLHESRFRELAGQYQKNAETADNFCKGEVQVADSQLDDLLNDLAASVQQADVCKCQLTAGSVPAYTSDGQVIGSSCDAVATALTCAQNVNQVGCSFSSVSCVPGTANCTSAVAATTGGSGLKGVSGFAGPGFSSVGGGLTGAKPVVGDENFSLYDETRPIGSGTTQTDAGSPFGTAGGGGGGGGGGMANFGSGGSGGGAGKEGDGEKSGLGGLFQSAKNGLANMFGGGTNGSGSSKKTDPKKYGNDVNALRPKSTGLRGMASASEVGTKNRDIWKVMNERYTDQYHTFITVEAPSK